MALILNIESATARCSIALARDGKLLQITETTEIYQHSARITLLIQECMQKANLALSDLDAVAVSKGPGSYTSLRVGMSTAKGLCFGLGVPMIGISTLKALAQGMLNRMSEETKQSNPLIAPMIDARRMEVYTNLYDLDLETSQEDEAKIIEENSYKDFFVSEQNIIFTGDGAKKCIPVLTHARAVLYPSEANAQDMVPLAELAFQEKAFLDIAYAEPFYLKPPNITTPKKLL